MIHWFAFNVNFFGGDQGWYKERLQASRITFLPFFFKKKETFFMWHQSISQFPGGSGVKNLPAMQEKRVRSLSWEDPLEEETATHSSVLGNSWTAWEN